MRPVHKKRMAFRGDGGLPPIPGPGKTPAFTATRGIRIVSMDGENLPLYEGYYALVVGISDYKTWPDLPFAARDAKEVAERLEKMGFEVSLVVDPDSRELETAINKMTYEMGRAQNRAVLFYYAGHGETEDNGRRHQNGLYHSSGLPHA